MSNLQPEQRADKNGTIVTRHVNPDKGVSAATTKRVAGAAPVATAKPVVDNPYIFASELHEFGKKEYFDVRDVSSVFDTYATELDTYMEQFDVEDKSTIMFDDDPDDDFSSFEDMKVEAAKWREILESLAESVSGVDVPIEPETDSVKDWSDHLMAISQGWEAVGDNHSVTLTNDNNMEDRAEEFFEDTGGIPRDMPDVLRRHIDWGGIADEIRREAPEADIEGTTFFLA